MAKDGLEQYGFSGKEGFLVAALTTDNTIVLRFEQFEATAEVLYDQFNGGPGIEEAFLMKVMKKSGRAEDLPLQSQMGKTLLQVS